MQLSSVDRPWPGRVPHAGSPRLTARFVALALALAMLPAFAVAQDRGYVGLEVRNVETAESDALGWEEPRGVVVVSILEGSPAVDSGVHTGDMIVSIDGVEIENIDAFVDAVLSKAPGTAVSLRLLREAKERRATLVLGVRPSSHPLPVKCSKYMPSLGRSIDVPCQSNE